MRINDNGIYRDATPEEIEEMERRRQEAEEQERHREATAEEKLEAQVSYTAMMTDTLLPQEG